MNKEKFCKCISSAIGKSNNWQTDKEIKLIPPFPNHPFGGKPTPHKTIYVDACIVNVLKYLWERNIYTKSSCCGHNLHKPSIVVKDEMNKENVKIIRKLIKEVDNRKWDICSWKLVKM